MGTLQVPTFMLPQFRGLFHWWLFGVLELLRIVLRVWASAAVSRAPVADEAA